ncbi:MAG: ABC transporter ATP-binding protein [Oscillospiraceae bacterium]|nr:ABC transporter ATP-binding protein [Oscillospiraceae bacterium]MBP1555068.1 ABC transporter ATP-binding protein [Oscillospiraceae bacterium]MBQ5341957.1 ABC transporter ATP-binding protein [Oscillospiraceae bacterium]
MLNVTNINVYYGNIHALHDMTFHVDDGEIVSLIGANGAGKSTTLKTISGLLRSHTGDIEFDGHSISRTEPDIIVRQGLTHVPEGRRIFLSMTVEENLDMGAFTIKEGKKKALDDVFDRFPRLAERRNQIAGTLSGGEQQMLAMGRALMIRPKMMMLDEPSMGLAPILVSQIMDIVVELNKAGTTILLVEQNARMALRISHRSYVIESGRIVLSDTSENLLNNEQVKKAYLGG